MNASKMQEKQAMNKQSEIIRVLLVEDNPGDARLIWEMLAEAGTNKFELAHVERLSEAIKRLAEGGIDVVLLDLSLPDEHGLDTVDRVCTAVPHVPVVVLTGLDDETLAIKAVQEGTQDYLVKGQMDSSLLMRAIRYAIERHRMQAALRSLSLIDDLTGLYNRRGFLTLAEQHLKLAHRTKRGLLLVFADLDGLKQINDTFGHQEGDLALIKTAEILKETFRASDIIARLGGDEFTVLAIDASDDSAEIIITRLQEKLKDYDAQKNHHYELSLSVGIARFDPKDTFSLEELMAKADGALYEHKRKRRKSYAGGRAE